MLKMKNTVTVILPLLFLLCTSCFGLFDSGSDQIVGDYYTLWIDEHSNRSISLKINDEGSYTQVISEYVYSVGHNDDYIIAKQHPKPDRFAENVNTKNTKFYIIDIKNSDEFVQKVFEFSDEKSFNKRLKELNAENIQFNLNYPENPANSIFSY